MHTSEIAVRHWIDSVGCPALGHHPTQNDPGEPQKAREGRPGPSRAALAAAMAEPRATPMALIEGLIGLLELHERDSRRHSQRVTSLTLALAAELGELSQRDRRHLEHAAQLHDIGKLHVPASILTKPAPLDDFEWEVMRRHPQVGYDLLKNLPALAGAAGLVLAHHEAFDGSGYPKGLEGRQIPIGARILAVADSYDSMTHPHTPRRPMTPSEALGEVDRCSGTQFDPRVAEALGRVWAGSKESRFRHAALRGTLQDMRD